MIFYLLNKGQQTVKLLNNDETIESNLDEAINTASELKFSLPLQKRLDSNIYYILIPEYHGNDFLMFKIISEDVQKDRVEYSAVESAYDELKSYEYIKDIRPHQMNAAQMLQQVLKNTRWSLGYVEDTGIQSTTFYYITILEAIQKIVDLFKVELTFTIQLDPVTQKITGRRINLYQQQGRRTGKRFEYGSNLLTVTREEDSQNLVTALVGRGKGIQVSGQDTEDASDDNYGRRLTFADVEWKTSAGAPVNKPKGQEYVEDPKATALYGFSDGHPRIGLVTFDDIEDPNQLINATWSALLEAKRPKVSFKAEVTDVGNLQLGDTIAIIRHDLGIEYFTRVYKVHHNLKDENRNTVEMGDDFSSRSITSAISTAIQTSQDATTVANTAAIAANGKNRNFYSNTKPLFANEGDNLFLNLGNGETEMWVWHHGQWEFVQSTVELHTVQKEVKEAQNGLDDAKKQIADNLAKADGDIAELNASIRDQKKAFDTDIDELNKSISDQKGSLDGLSTTINTVAIPKITDVTNKVSDALTKINDQKNIVTGLQTQSAQQGKDISKITTDIHGVSVDLANLNGDVNQTKVTVQGLQSTLGNAQGDIAQIKVDAKRLETSLSGKVDNSTYATFVNQTNQALNAKLVASDLNGYAKTADVQATANGLRVDLNSVTDRMNNLKIGGRNLLHNTSDQYRTLTNDGVWLQKSTASDTLTSVANYHSGDRFTYAATVTNTSNQTVRLEFHNCGQDKQWLTGIQSSPVPVGAKDYRVAVSFPVTEKTYYLQTWLIFQGGKGVPGEQIQVKDERLVFGTISNTWSPNPEDVAQNITELSSRITANSQQFSSYYTKTETDTRTNSVKNDTINTIKNDSNWQGLNNILTNSGFLQTAEGFTQKVQQTTMPMFKGGGVNLQTGTDDCSFPFTANLGKAVVEKYDSHTNMIHAYGSYSGFYLGYNSGYFIPDVGETYTFSADIKGKGSIDGNSFKWEGSDSTSMGTITLSNNWQRIRNTIHISQNKGTWVIYPTPDGSGVSDFYIKHIKIERGSVDTPWSPNPADLATQLSFTELTQTVNGLQTTVNNDFGNLKSQISQTAGTISTVVGKVNNLEIATNVQVVDHGIDLNTYKSTGTWFVKGAGTNAPESAWFYLDVKTAWDGRIVQIWQRDDVPTDRYVRTYANNQWSNWERSASYSEYSTLNQTVKGLQFTVSGNYGNLQSQISQTAKTIRTELTDKFNNVQNQITTTANGLNAKLTNLRVGGRNLLHNTSDKPKSLQGSGWLAQSTASDIYTSTANYHGGDEFTYSALITNNSSKPVTLETWLFKDRDSFHDPINVNSHSQVVPPHAQNQRVSTTFAITAETHWIRTYVIYSNGDGISSEMVNVSEEQLEEGNIRTPWTPNPDDISNQFTELNATINGLQSTVSNNYTNLQSQISQTAGMIRSEVTNKTNNLQSQITQNANNINIKVNAVGDLSNICLNPSFIDGSTQGWENVFSSLGDSRSPTKFYGGVSTRDAFYGNMFPVATGDKYFFSVFAWQNQSTHPLNVGLQCLQKDGSWNWQSAVNFAPNEGARTKSGSITIPNEAVKARIWVQIDAYSDYGNWWFTNLTVRKNDTISQINMSAGTTLIQNDKIYMDASSTVFSGKAFIPDAAITNISADKINTGTLDAGRINVINLNANNITTGTINGANLKIDLNSGEILFQKGRIGSTNGNLNIDIDSGKMSVTDWSKSGVFFENGELYLSDKWGYTNNWKPRYGVIRRSRNAFTVGECGIEIASPSGVSLQTMNYDGAFGSAGFLDQTTSGASVAVDQNGQALINAKQVGLTGGTFFSDNKFIPSKRRPRIVVGTDAATSGLNSWGWGNPLNHVASRIVIDASYVHFPNSYNTTTGSAPNAFIASDGALVRSTSASKYKTEIKRSYSTEYGEKLLNLPTAIWTDKGQKERYKAGKRHIKPEKYFGMIAEDLADAGLDLLVSRNPLTHEIEGIQYERIAPALLPVIKELKDKVNKLEKKVNE